MNEAAIGFGVQLQLRTSVGPDIYTIVGQQNSVTPPSESVDSIDTSHTQSPEEARESIPGLVDNGETTISLNYVPGGDAEITLRAALRKIKHWRVVFPNGSYFEFDAYITGFERETPIDDKMTADVTFKITGKMIMGAAAVPVNSVLPAISGTPQEGLTLTAFDGLWTNSPTSFSYVWKNEGVAINGATLKTYTPVAGDVGANITVTVTASNSAGAAVATSAETLPVIAA